MALCTQYRVLPFPIACDTLLICYNPYFDVQFKQCYSLEELLSLLEQAPLTHRTVLFADTFEAGTELVEQVGRLKREALKKESCVERVGEEAEVEAVNDRLFLLAEKLVQRPQQKSSFLHLKCLLNKTEDKISSITSQIKAQEYHSRPSRHDKRAQKHAKTMEKDHQRAQKQLKELHQSRETLQQEIITHQQTQWWKEQCRQSPLLTKSPLHSESESSCEALLSDSEEEEKENLLLLQ